MISELFFQGRILTNCLLYGTILLAAGLIAAALCRRSAARAHQVLLLAMVAAVLVPAMSALVEHYELGIFTAKAAPAPPPVTESTVLAKLTLPMTTELEPVAFQYELGTAEEYYAAATVSTAASPARSFPWRSVLPGLWLLASVALLGRLIVTFVLGKRVLKKAAPLASGAIQQAADVAREKLAINRPLVILTSNKIASPVIWCWSRHPVLLIPRTAEAPDNNCHWIALFCHELAHLKRLDHITGLFAELLVCIFPWQPLAWLAKRRLMALSEQACDDWAVVTSNSGAGYARSLLDMVPQSQPAFAPTVLPSKKQLAARIRRIVRGERPNPRPGRRWALLAVVVALFLAVTISFAQTRPADDRRIDQAEQAEREALERLERGLAGEGERLRDREHPEAAELRERKMHARELQQHRKELQQRAKEIQLELKEHPDHPEKQELHAALGEIEQQMIRIDAELRGPRRDRPPIEAREADPRLRKLMQHREELQVRAEQIELELRELGDRNPDRSHQLRAEMTDIAREMEVVEREFRGAREAREPRDADIRNRELMQHRAELLERAEHIKREIKELGDKHPDESHELRAQLGQIEEQLGRIDRMLRSPHPRDDAPEMRELMQHRAGLLERAEHIELELREIGDKNPDRSHQLRGEMKDIANAMETIERELRAARGGQEPRDADIRNRELMQHRAELQERAENIKRELIEIGDSRPDQAHELRRQLEDIRERMRDIEAGIRGGAHEERDVDPRANELMLHRRELEKRADRLKREIHEIAGTDPGKAEAIEGDLRRTIKEIEAIERRLHGQEPERPPDVEPHIRELMERRRDLEAHARETKILIDRFESEEDKAAERRALEDIHKQMEAIDRELRGLEREVPREIRREPRDDIEHQVDRLRGEVNELRGQMAEIRNLLERLLEREQPRRTDRPRNDAEF